MRWHELTEQVLAQSMTGSDDIDLFEMANLEPAKTGIDGTIYISTQQAGHAPRVKYFAGRPGNNQPSMSVSIAPQPEVVVSSLPKRITAKMAPIVQQWVTLNYAQLHEFWFKGNTWYTSEVEAFIAGLKKWTPQPRQPAGQDDLP